MSSGFSSNELLKSVSNYPVAKGDVVGHPFHGNQYTAGTEAHMAHDLVSITRSSENAQVPTVNSFGNPVKTSRNRLLNQTAADLLKQGAERHEAISAKMKDLAEAKSLFSIKNPRLREQAKQGASAHAKAAVSLRAQANRLTNSKGYHHDENDVYQGDMKPAVALSEHADTKFPDLSEAQIKEMQKSLVSKGDVAGHAFHGNQYVSAGNQAAESQKLRDYVKDNGANRIDHFAVSEQHRNIARALEEAAKQLEGEKGHQASRIREANTKAAEAHREAAGRHLTAFVNPGTSENVPHHYISAMTATQKAHDASLKADELNYAG
jgi:hypothetical protein